MAKKDLYGVWPKGRNTPIVVRASDSSEAREKAKRTGAAGSKGPVQAAKKLSEQDAAKARRGEWVRTRADGSTSSSSGSFKYRPQLKAKAKGRKLT